MDRLPQDDMQHSVTRPRTLPNVASRSQHSEPSALGASSGLREITPSRKNGSRSLVKVYDTCDVDGYQDEDEFGFRLSSSPSDTVTVTIKLSGHGIETDTVTGGYRHNADITALDLPEEAELIAVGGEDIRGRSSSSDVEHGTNDIRVTPGHVEEKGEPPKRPQRRHRGIKISKDSPEPLSTNGNVKSKAELLSEMTTPNVDADISTNTHELPIALPYIDATSTNLHTDVANATANAFEVTPDVSVSPRSKTRIVYDTGDSSVTPRTPIVVDRSGVSVEDEGEDFMEYLKALKNSPDVHDITDTYVDISEVEEEQTSRRHDSGGNGYHSDQEEAGADITVRCGNTQSELEDNASAGRQTEITDIDHVVSDIENHPAAEETEHDSDTEDEEDSNETSGDGNNPDTEHDNTDDEDGDRWYSGSDMTNDSDDVYSSGENNDDSDDSDDIDNNDSATHQTPGVRSRCDIVTEEDNKLEHVPIVITTNSNSPTSTDPVIIGQLPTTNNIHAPDASAANDNADIRECDDAVCLSSTDDGIGTITHVVSGGELPNKEVTGMDAFDDKVSCLVGAEESIYENQYIIPLAEEEIALLPDQHDDMPLGKDDIQNSQLTECWEETDCLFTVDATFDFTPDPSEETLVECMDTNSLIPGSPSRDSTGNMDNDIDVVDRTDTLDHCVDEYGHVEDHSLVEDELNNHIITEANVYIDGQALPTFFPEKDNNPEHTHANNLEIILGNNTDDSTSLVDCSSILSSDIASLCDFESAIEEDFWRNIASSPTTSDHISDSSVDCLIHSEADSHEDQRVIENELQDELERVAILHHVPKTDIRVEIDCTCNTSEGFEEIKDEDVSCHELNGEKQTTQNEITDQVVDDKKTATFDSLLQHVGDNNNDELECHFQTDDESVEVDKGSCCSPDNLNQYNDACDEMGDTTNCIHGHCRTVETELAKSTTLSEIEVHSEANGSLESNSVFEEITEEPYFNQELAIERNNTWNVIHEDNDEKRDPEKDDCIYENYQIHSNRTITYDVPYIIQDPEPELINPSKQKVLKYMCKQRMVTLKYYGLIPATDRNVSLLEAVDNIIPDIYEPDCAQYKLDMDTSGRNNSTLSIDSGFIILDAAANLNMPRGPKLKTKVDKYAKNKIDVPCVYYRGIPGVVDNAYTMSNSIFPSKHPCQSDSASHQILHACRRLATNGSPTFISPTSDFKHGMMLDEDFSVADDNASTTYSELNALLVNARDLLNLSQFDDAESTFLKLYQQIQEKPEDCSNLLVETLTGLADICIRRSRMCRSNPLEWQWLCMHAIALLQFTAEFCDSELENDIDNQQTDWFQEQKHASELKCRPLEDTFIRALYNCLNHDAGYYNPFQSFSLPSTPTSPHNKRTNLFPLNSTMPQYLVVPGMRYRMTEQGFQKQSADDSSLAVDWLAKFQHYCKDRLQTRDSKVVTVKILRSTVNKADDDTETVISVGSHGSMDWDNGDLQGLEELTEDVIDDESPVKEYSFAFELASGNADNNGWKFFLNDRRSYTFRSVLEVKNDDMLKEADDDNEPESKEIVDTLQKEKRRKRVEKDIISPLHEHSISLTLSRSYCRLAEKLVHEEEYRKAEVVYEKIVDIIDDIQDGTAGMLRFSARILKNLGTVKSKQGKSSSGLILLNRALETYRDLQDEEANFEIAVALIELGNGYIVGKNNENSVFDDVIVAICDFFEKDASDTESTSSSGSTSQMTSSVMTSSMKSEVEGRNVEEAVMCFTEAISLLDRYEADEEQLYMLARAVMRLGDCHFMQKDYDRALECYEKTISMFRSNKMIGKESLVENAHVLCMLGVSSFMLHVYPRAASVFEMALHMVKCSYGFTRTFFIGMLQSLCGITYYKMKNYHKCVSMCYQSYDTYKEIFGDDMSRLDRQKFWLVCQTLYVMGNSYNMLNLQQRAMKYLTIARSLMKSSKCRERRQFMRVLQILGDSYFAQYDYKVALQYYNEALDYGECESQVSFDEQFDSNYASDEMTIHNHLVSKSAEAHLSMQQYEHAVHYLEQAHDMQEVMGEDIKEDLINTLNQLGQMHSVSGDIDKAIESYRECMEVFREIHNGKLGPEMCTTLGNLAAICYVKACISDDVDQELNMMIAAEQYFTEALKLQPNPEICVKYATFLYSQFNFHHAIMYLNDALKVDVITSDIVYRGLEKVTLPDLLQDEVDTQEEICLPTTCLARYLQILSHKSLGHLRVAEEHLLSLMEEVIDYDIPLLHSLLGYAMMELSLFDQAASCFYTATVTEENYQLASENYCICLIILTLETLQNAFEHLWYHYSKRHRNHFQVKY